LDNKNKSVYAADQSKIIMFKGLDHIAIAVSNTEEALKTWRDKFGFKVLFAEKVNDNTVLLTHLDMGNVHLQLVEPLVRPHPVWDWLEKNGGDGLHHFCLKTDDILETKEKLRYLELTPAPTAHQGVQGNKALFIQKNTTGGVQVELTGK
jgi:methylmalonyl-CoA/ethylmalonyl-CoA epimerase